MFVDYYALFEINEIATLEEIKKAYRVQCIKWHPDKHPNTDTTEIMQLINEAKLILCDAEARMKYDTEYQKFKAYKKQEESSFYNTNAKQEQKAESKKHSSKTEYSNYSFVDEELKNWMKNARKQSVGMAKQTIRDFKGMVKAGAKAGIQEAGRSFMAQIVISIIVLVVIAISKGCQ